MRNIAKDSDTNTGYFLGWASQVKWLRNMGALTSEKIRKIKEILAGARGTGYNTSQIVERMNSDLNSREVEWFCRMSDAIIESKTDKNEIRWILKNSSTQERNPQNKN